jgi:hypothetical protein
MGRAGIEPATLGLEVDAEAQMGRDRPRQIGSIERKRPGRESGRLGVSRWVVLPHCCPLVALPRTQSVTDDPRDQERRAEADPGSRIEVVPGAVNPADVEQE